MFKTNNVIEISRWLLEKDFEISMAIIRRRLILREGKPDFNKRVS